MGCVDEPCERAEVRRREALLPRERAAQKLLAVQARALLCPDAIDVHARDVLPAHVDAQRQHRAPRRVFPRLGLQRPIREGQRVWRARRRDLREQLVDGAEDGEEGGAQLDRH
eukprot:3937054-Rhodomonas_salina.1